MILSSVEKKGQKNIFSYTLKLKVLQNGQEVSKKKNISASEYN